MSKAIAHTHVYSRTTCPDCEADLTRDAAVTIEGRSNKGAFLGEFTTQLDADGRLVPDGDGVVAAGQHAGSSCSACGEPLDDFETTPGT